MDMPELGARDWLTRDEAAAALKKNVRTVDRLLARGKLHRVGEGVPVQISKTSVEHAAGELVAAVRRVPTVVLELDTFDAMRLQIDRQAGQLRDREQALLTWQGQVAELEATIEREKAARADAEAIADRERCERERLAAELEAERDRPGFFGIPRWLRRKKP